MTDAELIVSAVKSDTTLSGLLAGDMVYPVVLPQDPELPAMTYVLVSQPTEHTQEQAQYRWPRWRFRIYSLRYADLIPIAVGIAAIFGDRTRSPLGAARIEYPSSQAEGHETDTHRYWRAIDVVSFAPAGATSQ
jgi:hypothetical protein